MARYYIQTAAGPKRKTLYAKSRSEAATMLVRAIAERDGSGPITIESSKLSTADYFAEWLASKKSELVPDTHRRYSGIIEHHLSPALGSLKLAELRRAHVEHLVSCLLYDKLEPSTIRYIMAVLSAALNQATGVKRPEDRSQKIRALSEEVAARLMTVVRGTRREVLYDVALTLGPLQGEPRGLRWPDMQEMAADAMEEYAF